LRAVRGRAVLAIARAAQRWPGSAPTKAGPPTEHLASGPYADHHLLCVNGAMTGSEGLRRGAAEFPPMGHSSAPYFSVSARNQTDAANREFERKQESRLSWRPLLFVIGPLKKRPQLGAGVS
jgi:hypothetical protein